jgi:hypothetical protein
VVLAGDVPSLEAPDGLAGRPGVFRIPDRHQEPCLDKKSKSKSASISSYQGAWHGSSMKDKRSVEGLKHKDTGGRTYRRGG